MKVDKLSIGGALVEPTVFEDHRGTFSRFFCQNELKNVLDGRNIVNVNYSKTVKKGAIRGMHYQRTPCAEMKMVRCIKGTIFDVFVDIRRGSPTFLQWFGTTLSAENKKMLVVPEGFAHGFQALEENVEILYLATEFYSPDYEGGIHYNDPLISIKWPLDCAEVSVKDKAIPLLSADYAGVTGI